MRSLYDCTSLHRPFSRLSRTALQDLATWADFQFDGPLNGVPIFRSPTSRALYTDASGGVGWGGVLPTEAVQQQLCAAFHRQPTASAEQLHQLAEVPLPANLWQQSTTCAGGWDADLLPLHINFKELRAVHKSLLAWRAELQGHRVLLFCYNTTVVQMLRKGTSRSALLMAELRQVWTLLHTLKVDLVPVYIASADNPADFPSRHSMSAEWTFRPGLRQQLHQLSPRAYTLDPLPLEPPQWPAPFAVYRQRRPALPTTACAFRGGSNICSSIRHGTSSPRCCSRSSRTAPAGCSLSRVGPARRGGRFCCACARAGSICPHLATVCCHSRATR